MRIDDFMKVSRKYKACPSCGSSWKDTKMKVEVEGEIVTISCTCGFLKKVDKDNNEIGQPKTKEKFQWEK